MQCKPLATMRKSILFLTGIVVSLSLACSAPDTGITQSADTHGGADSGAHNTSAKDSGSSATDDPDSAASNDDAGESHSGDDAGEVATDSGASDGAAHDAGAHDGAAHDASADSGAGGNFGDVCAKDADCKSKACFIGGQGNYCSILCTTNAQCPVPPTSGVCNPKGYCKK
jgi:hypothetical protein